MPGMFGAMPGVPRPGGMMPGVPRPGGMMPGMPRPGGIGTCVKVSNLAPGVSQQSLKDALQVWGVTGITEVVISEGRFGPVAMMRFKTEAETELMMLANGIEVEGAPLRVELLPAAPAAPQRPGKRVPPPAWKQPAPSNLLKVVGVPKDTTNAELMTCLRSYGILGIVEVQLVVDAGLVRFQTPQNVKSAIEKAASATLKGAKLTLQEINHHEWRRLEDEAAAAAAAEADGPSLEASDEEVEDRRSRRHSGTTSSVRSPRPRRISPRRVPATHNSSEANGRSRGRLTSSSSSRKPSWATEGPYEAPLDGHESRDRHGSAKSGTDDRGRSSARYPPRGGSSTLRAERDHDARPSARPSEARRERDPGWTEDLSSGHHGGAWDTKGWHADEYDRTTPRRREGDRKSVV